MKTLRVRTGGVATAFAVPSGWRAKAAMLMRDWRPHEKKPAWYKHSKNYRDALGGDRSGLSRWENRRAAERFVNYLREQVALQISLMEMQLTAEWAARDEAHRQEIIRQERQRREIDELFRAQNKKTQLTASASALSIQVWRCRRRAW